MKKLLALLLLSPLAFSAEQILKVDMNCKVTAQTLIKSVDGVATIFSGYKDGLEVGDMVTLSFKHTHFVPVEGEEDLDATYWLQISDDDGLLTSFNYYGGGSSNTSLDGIGITYYMPNWGNSSLSEDRFHFNSWYSSYKAERYYKNDWQIIVTQLIGQESRILTGNCMNMPSTWNEMIDKIKSVEKRKTGY